MDNDRGPIAFDCFLPIVEEDGIQLEKLQTNAENWVYTVQLQAITTLGPQEASTRFITRFRK